MSLPNLRHYPGIYLKRLRKIMEKLSQDRRSPDRDFKPGPPEYEAGMLTTRPRLPVRVFFKLTSEDKLKLLNDLIYLLISYLSFTYINRQQN
jgi:hypothetical protein